MQVKDPMGKKEFYLESAVLLVATLTIGQLDNTDTDNSSVF